MSTFDMQDYTDDDEKQSSQATSPFMDPTELNMDTQSLARATPGLPPIAEDEVLLENANEDIVVSLRGSRDVETTALVKSGHTFSYTESAQDFDPEEGDEFSAEEGEEDTDGDQVLLLRDQFGSSIMTDFQASLFLPSIQVSLHSTLHEQSQDTTNKSRPRIAKRRPSFRTMSAYHSKSVLISLIEKVSDDRGSSLFLTVWNILPALLGSALFAMPYIVAQGGYLILIPLVAICVLADVTGKLLVECLYEISPRSKNSKRVRLDLVDIAYTVFGKHGSRVINFLTVFFLTAVDIVNLVLLGDSVNAIVQDYTDMSPKVITAISALFTIPTLFIRKLSTLAYLSMLSVLSIVAGGIAVMVIFVQQNEVWQNNLEDVPLWRPEGSLLAVSMILYTVIAHPMLAQIEGSMRDPDKFNSALHMSYVSSTVVKAIVGLLGCFTFGVVTMPVVSLNISLFSQAASIACSVALIGYAIFSFPLNLFVVCQLFDSVTIASRFPQFKKEGQYHLLWLLISRPILVGLCLAVAVVIPYFNYLVGIVGSFIGASMVFVFPPLFHFILKKKKISKASAAFDIFLVIFGALCGLVGLYASVRGLISAMLGNDQ